MITSRDAYNQISPTHSIGLSLQAWLAARKDAEALTSLMPISILESCLADGLLNCK